MTLQPWKILNSTYLHEHVRLDTIEVRQGKVISGVVLEYGDWVTVVALTPDKQVVLERQYRHGVQDVIVELPGGSLDSAEEDPLEAAKRELLEETGYTSETFVQIGKVCPNPANMTNHIYSFLALDVKKVSGQHLDDTEEIEVELRPLDEVICMAKTGQLIQSMQVSAVFFALAYLERII
jgi:ADP-ribose pyrophosphatase